MQLKKYQNCSFFVCEYFIAAWGKWLPKLRYLENSLAANKLLTIKAKLLA